MSVGGVLFDILVVLLAAKVAAEISERIGIPAVVGEIVAGIAIGPSLLGLVEGGEVLRVLGEIGVILLLLEVGLQMDLAELGAVGRASLTVALIGVAVPFAAGFGVAAAFGWDATTSIFLGAALTATSVGITARVFADLRALASVEARTVLGAAVADDVLGLVILTVVVRLVDGGSITVGSVGSVVVIALGFLVVTAAVGTRVAPTLFRVVRRGARSPGTLIGVTLAFALGFAELASAAKLAPIVGAFVAGLCLARTAQAPRIRRELAPVGHLFVPVFFLQIGIDTDVAELVRPPVLALAGCLLVAAVIGKVVAAVGLGRSPGDRLLVGLGMLPRGEVGLIFAGIGLREGVLGPDLYGALLLVVLATTLMSPPLLRWRMASLRAGRRASVAISAEPEGGWLRVGDGVVDLAADPPDHLALHLGLQAARAAVHARPGPALLGFFGGLPSGPLRWDPQATEELFAVLREGTPRSWRLLDLTGVLERALPELAEAFERRQADPFELDPSHSFRWQLVDGLHDVLTTDRLAAQVHRSLDHPEWLLLAALVADAMGDAESVVAARRLAKRLDLGAAAEQEIALLVGETGLLRASAARPDGLTESAVLQVASHLGSPERATALYLLTIAAGDLSPAQRVRLDGLHTLIQEALVASELTNRETRNLVEGRKAAAAGHGTTPAVVERINATPGAFVLTQDAGALARQAALLEPLPLGSAVRVAVTPRLGLEAWDVDVACRDRPGLLAAVTGALAEARLDVLEASAATWGDGGVVEAFTVGALTAPMAEHLGARVTAALDDPLPSSPTPGAVVTFDDAGSPWYTLCAVEAPDRRGLLHALAVAFAICGADVHSARITTDEGRAVDRFELTDRRGRKLDEAAKEAIRAAISSGVQPRRARRRRPRTVGMRRKHSGHSVETPVPYVLP